MFIREMAKRVHLSEDTLRYYEKIGLLAHVPRDAGGHRVYGEVEIEEVQKIV
ncbi:MAG TPA: MerR family transcriptional regulator, partial [Megasphaera sp.]|nr:MerR family transcriptional regulator [Megasphaera sp.]